MADIENQTPREPAGQTQEIPKDEATEETVNETQKEAGTRASGRPEAITGTLPEENPEKTYEGILEAVLFSMGDSVETSRLASLIRKSREETVEILHRLQERYSRPEYGIQLLELDGSWQLATKTVYYDNLVEIAKQPKKPVLTDVMMETLSIIAYKQPVTKAEIERIRGVSSDHAVNRLLEYGLVKELGRLNVPGRPILFGTTEKFLRSFGVESTDDLPEINPVKVEDFKAEAEAELNVKVDV